jgi:hypothetical protein
MAGLLKELLLDYGLHRLPIDQRNDISTAITSLYTAGVITNDDLRILNTYLSGYNAEEIASMFSLHADDIEQTLTRVIEAIETASGYTDDDFVYRVIKSTKYPKTKIGALGVYLRYYGRRFDTHEPTKAA